MENIILNYCDSPTYQKTCITSIFFFSNSGRVVIVSSVKGLHSFPANSAYHVTKYGLETMADSLRLEMLKFGVTVSIVEPGNFSTATACQDDTHVTKYMLYL